MRPVARRLIRIGIGLACVLAIGVWWLYRTTQQEPIFYRQALAAPLPPPQARAACDQLERQVLELHNNARREGQWEATFTEQQLNTWLAEDLVKKFPRALPSNIREPRVKISPQQIQLACRYTEEPWQTVLSLTVEAYLTETPNELAIRIREFRAGRLPLPMQRFLDDAKSKVGEQGVPLRWTQQQADPVALVQLPLRDARLQGRMIVLDALKLGEGTVVVSGHTQRPP